MKSLIELRLDRMKIKALLRLTFATLMILFASSCDLFEEEEEEEPQAGSPAAEEQVDVNQSSIIPSTTSGRPNNLLGCIEIGSRITTIEVWDHGQIDGDVISIYANGQTIISEEVLDGPSNPITTTYDFGFNGYNYVTLYAHNLGDIPPNTCTIAINGVQFVLEANLDANGSVDVIVGGYGVSCGSGGGGIGGGGTGGGGGSGGGGGGSSTGDVIFWTNADFGCGPISVDVSGIGSSTISGYFPGGAPDCSNTSAGGNFNDLDPGTYSFSANCSNLQWNGNVTISENTCLRFELTN